MPDPLVGTWKLNPGRSEFDPNHQPSAGTMILELTPDGHYALTAEGVTERGEKCTNRPAKLIPDGKEHPVPDFPGLLSVRDAMIRSVRTRNSFASRPSVFFETSALF